MINLNHQVDQMSKQAINRRNQVDNHHQESNAKNALEIGASETQVKVAYRAVAKIFHPNRIPNDKTDMNRDKATVHFQLLKQGSRTPDSSSVNNRQFSTRITQNLTYKIYTEVMLVTKLRGDFLSFLTRRSRFKTLSFVSSTINMTHT